MTPRPLELSPAFREMARGSRELHRLLAEGKDDSPEADAIRDATDAPWQSLSETDRRRIRNLSEDLYSLHEPVAVARESNPQARSKLADAFEARTQGDWDRALDLLRRWGSYLDPATVSYFRGSIWLDGGDPATAALFFEHAAKLQPDDENFPTLFLHALALADPEEGGRRAEAILKEADRWPPMVVARASNMHFESRQSLPGVEIERHLRYLIPILTETIRRLEDNQFEPLDRTSYILVIFLLGSAYELLGQSQLAVAAFSKGLQVAPTNDVLLGMRGMSSYGTSAQAISDFELAVGYRSDLTGPYFFLAHDRLITGRFDECRKLCEQALAMPGSATLKSELYEWMAIAQSELGFPADLVRASFEEAISRNPSNDMAVRNRDAFEAALRTATKAWEMRSPASVRISGLVDLRSQIAA